MPLNHPTVAVVGATGVVGSEVIKILEEREFPVGDLRPFASQNSLGEEVQLNRKPYPVDVLRPGCFDGVDIAFFDVSDDLSAEWIPVAAEAGAWVIDNSAAFREREGFLIAVPEVNGDLIRKQALNVKSWQDRVFPGPNCSTAQLVLVLDAIQRRWPIERVVVSTYQSVSGAGKAAMEELSQQTIGLFSHQDHEPKAFPHPIAFNCLPHVGGFDEDGHSSEERKIVAESQKILGLPDLKITATAVRVPVFSCHSESVNIQLRDSFEVAEVRKVLDDYEGIQVFDDPKQALYPLSRSQDDEKLEAATGRDPVYVGRIRRDGSLENAINLWIVADNLRKGAALNAVQIGEIVLDSTQ